MKKTLSTILLGASLIFGAGNVKAQECQIYNHDEDDFPEEIVGWKRERFNEPKYPQNKMALTVLYCGDKDNDNSYEEIRIFNCSYYYNPEYSNTRHVYWTMNEYFYINKNTGLIDYTKEERIISMKEWSKSFADKNFIEFAKLEFNNPRTYSPYLTQQDLYNMGLGARIKTLINAFESRDTSEIKRLAEVERNSFKTFLNNVGK